MIIVKLQTRWCLTVEPVSYVQRFKLLSWFQLSTYTWDLSNRIAYYLKLWNAGRRAKTGLALLTHEAMFWSFHGNHRLIIGTTKLIPRLQTRFSISLISYSVSKQFAVFKTRKNTLLMYSIKIKQNLHIFMKYRLYVNFKQRNCKR